MILVTDPGTYSAVYPPLLHALWNGATPTDMIFPSFLLITGVAMTLSFASRLKHGGRPSRLFVHVLRRSLIILALGLLVNGFPRYSLHTLRIPGVLQRIALCYFLGASIYLAASTGSARQPRGRRRFRRASVIAASVVGLLALDWALLKLVPVPGFGRGHLDSAGNLGAYLDRSVWGVQHMWAYGTTPGLGVTFDPEGLLSTLPALATLLIGVLAGEWLSAGESRRRKPAVLAIAGACLVSAGLALSPWLPLNKKLGTSTFALFSSGVALVAFSIFYHLLDVMQWRRWTTPALVFGTNAILAFALSNVLTTVTDTIHLATRNGPMTLHEAAYTFGFAPWLQPVHASLCYAMAVVLLNLALIFPLYRRRIFLRV